MLHIATSHASSARWIDIQLRQLHARIPVAHTIWGSLPPAEQGERGFDRVVRQRGPEPGRLNHLAVEIAQQAAPDDLLMFLAPDAFPIADPMPAIEQALSRAPLLALTHQQDDGDPQPQPSFCVTTVGAWQRLAGDWCDGFPWPLAGGGLATGVGGNLLRRLQLAGESWIPITRSSPSRLDPLFFGVYGGIVYHHAAGLLGRVHRAQAPRPLPTLPGLAPLSKRVDAGRSELWERALLRRTRGLSAQIHSLIAAAAPGWEDELREGFPSLARV